jgi:hypothetical protein
MMNPTKLVVLATGIFLWINCSRKAENMEFLESGKIIATSNTC